MTDTYWERLFEACQKAGKASLDEGAYGRKGWFTAWDVKFRFESQDKVKEIRNVINAGYPVVEGAREDQYAAHTSACVFRIKEVM